MNPIHSAQQVELSVKTRSPRIEVRWQQMIN